MSRFSLSRQMKLALAIAPICFLGTMVGATTVQARENYALIVAASDYENLDQKYWLKGPKNDETLVRDFLLSPASPVAFDAKNVVSLGTGQAELATHKAILDHLATIASEAKAGDFVYLHFSGHGSTEPALTDTTEQDGRDEVFLAEDTKMAPADNPTYMPNVLTDDEVGNALKAIRKTGASVWVVFDSCHSATMNRGAPDESGTMDREITPAQLGIPDSAFKVPATTTDADANGGQRAVPLAGDVYAEDAGDANEGPLVAFFAAQTTETTSERPFDVPQADGTTAKINYGVFTYTIFSALAKNPGMTYRQLAQTVLASYSAGNVLKPVPLFEGDLDKRVFAGPDVQNEGGQWPTTIGNTSGKVTIAAGQLQGLDVGTKLLVLPTPIANNDEAIRLMQVSAVTQLQSTLTPASDDKHQLVDPKTFPKGVYVRLAEVNYPFELKVARPDPATSDPDEAKAVNAALDAIIAEPTKQMKLEAVDPGAAADVRLAVLSEAQVAKLADDSKKDPAAKITPLAQMTAQSSGDPTPKLWLLPSSGEISLEPTHKAPTMPLPQSDPLSTAADPDFKASLETNLTTIFRATALGQLAQVNTYKPKDFSLSFGLQQAGSDQIQTMDASQTPIIRPGDRLHVDMTNNSGKPMDLNVLYIDHDFGITLICKAHLNTGDHLNQPMADINETDQGAERMIAVINESGSDLNDLSFLAQTGLKRDIKGVPEVGLQGMLSDLGLGQSTRGPGLAMAGDSNTPRGAVAMMPVEAKEQISDQPAAKIAPADASKEEGSC